MTSPLYKLLSGEIVVCCAWCQVGRDAAAKAIAEGKTVSHGLCKSCFDRIMSEEGGSNENL